MVTLRKKALEWTLPNHNGKKVSLYDFAERWVVLYFYPKDNTPGCTIEAVTFTKLLPEFKKAGAVILGVSPDSVKSHCQFQKKQKLNIELLSDESKATLKKYKVYYWMDEDAGKNRIC